MPIQPTDDIRSITDLKRNAREILDQIRETGRPVVLTVNGRADAVLMDARSYEKQLRAANLAGLLAVGEDDVAGRHVRSMRGFLKEFQSAER